MPNKKYVCLILFCLLLTGRFVQCTKGFQELNTNPNAVASVTPNLLLTTTLYSIVDENIDNSNGLQLGWQVNTGYNFATLELFIQHFMSPGGIFNFGKFYSIYNSTYDESFWDQTYLNSFKTATQLISLSATNPNYANYGAVGTILQAYIIQRLTDLYGDIPFSQAGQGFLNGIVYPKYDRQRDIYMTILNNLQTAATSLNASMPLLGDISSNNGVVTQWKQTAYSLMLRVAMRMIRVDPTNAIRWASIAEDSLGGASANLGNGFYITGTSQYFNANYAVLASPAGAYLFSYSSPYLKLSDVYIGLLKSFKDPRIFIWPTLRDASGNESIYDSADQKGLSVSDATAYSVDQLATFSQVRFALLTPTSPTFCISPAQTFFLLAELEERKTGTGTGRNFFKSGLTAAINQANSFGVSINTYLPPGSNVQAYVDSIGNMVYNSQGNLDSNVKLINQEYWLNTLFDGIEAFSNWRRTRNSTSSNNGYPALYVSTVSGSAQLTGGTIPSRLKYPISERTVNTQNYNVAVGNLVGGDNLTSRVWWDVMN
ncbi:MAG: SusD/RagB family nutrient-binding outer membrane lipoprotein [Phycisphaerales bacterium]|nr:SusD/RagB family nutrient-binding outer membrane lipoprotein [Phycisphaerales bacterium]